MSLLDRTPEADVSPAGWIVDSVRPFGSGVQSLVPIGFEAYARVFHPARLAEAAVVRWASVAAAYGREFHPLAQFGALIGTADYHPVSEHPEVWDEPPTAGSLDLDVARRLAGVLARHTTTAEKCWFAVWDGFGQLPLSWTSRPGRVRMPQRGMHLFRGPIGDIANSFDDPGGPDDVPRQGRSSIRVAMLGDAPIETAHAGVIPEQYQSASLWWPDDRSWCVATDVDLVSSYLAGSRACVDELIADPDLEVLEVPGDSAVDWRSDTINPALRD